MYLPPFTNTVRWSMTWVYTVSYDTTQTIEAEMVQDVLQCSNPAACPNAATVTGLSIKAADYAECSFFEEDKNGAQITPLNKTTITAGTDIKARCSVDSSQLKFGNITLWEQGFDGYNPTSAKADEIRNAGQL
jgi:hypothetical protein